VLAGEISPYFDFHGGVDRALLDGVTVTGRLGLEDFLRHMAACDVAVNLRWPTAGETSGTLIRLLGLGKPIVVTNAGAFAEVPDGCCVKVEHDATEGEHLFATLYRLATDAALRQALGENARRYAETEHAIERSAAGYLRLLEEVVATRPHPFDARPPLAPAGDVAEQVRARALARVCAGLADLGVDETDAVLVDLARRLAPLF
jgi:glycosyltransferase involved in cell wall biosynthesis